MLETLFELGEHGTSVRTECIAGLSTFLTMAYIVFVNPDILAAAGMPREPVFVATCLAAALGAVFISGCLFITVSVLREREWIVNAIPRSLKLAISAGIGLFLALIGLKNAGVVAADPATLVTLGDLHAPGPLFAAAGLLLIVALQARRVTG